MVVLRVAVPGLPPKKDGSASMWLKRVEVPRLIALRRALARVHTGPALAVDISIELVVKLRSNHAQVGDLDNMVTGICDGLQAAGPRAPWHSLEAWMAEPVDVRPDRAFIADDLHVVSIVARKEIGAEADSYDLVVKGRQ